MVTWNLRELNRFRFKTLNFELKREVSLKEGNHFQLSQYFGCLSFSICIFMVILKTPKHCTLQYLLNYIILSLLQLIGENTKRILIYKF